MSAAEAAAALGVSRATLYAYVSRGLVASEAGEGPTRARRYPRGPVEDLIARRERSRDRELAAHGQLHWGLPVLDSELTLIEGGRAYIRGHDLVALSRDRMFEEVAALLWTGDPDDAAVLLPPSGDDAAEYLPMLGGGPVVEALAAHLTAAGETSLPTLGAGDAVALRGAARVVAGQFAAAGAHGPGRLAERLARGWGSDRPRDIEAALSLSADHELNVSAFTARTVASADAGVEHVLLAALCALRGRRHGGLTDRVEALVRDAAADGPARAAERAMTDGGALPGFGHPLYPDGDPRGAELLRLATPADPAVAGLVALAEEQLGLRPTLDLGLAALSRALRLPPGAALGLFALGRSAGWVAHALEARRDDRLVRPRSRYTGPPPVGSSTP